MKPIRFDRQKPPSRERQLQLYDGGKKMRKDKATSTGREGGKSGLTNWGLEELGGVNHMRIWWKNTWSFVV